MTEQHPDGPAGADEKARRTLASKLNLLLDAVAAERGQPLTYREIATALDDRGVSLSRARWSYMLSGTGYLVTDEALLRGLAGYFEVSADYLLGGPDAVEPDRIAAVNELIAAMRAAKVRTFAARTLGEVSPPTLRAITEILNQVIDGPANEKKN
ncbi:transcriptional regulator with XRE-family HTH domain [Cryobacterium sp. MP_3.1]|uniref:hypothetical protein n=1 Tax=Cryobacterium sp. MP_3.1 TaxID=3071711 RepID=UPI002E055F5C|nr:transcriptional regulator with XRE-family HTH domain [Cryobacterium sp. MP_3.1]